MIPLTVIARLDSLVSTDRITAQGRAADEQGISSFYISQRETWEGIGEIMVPDDTEKVSLLWSAKTNALGHGYLGARGRRWSTTFMYASGILGYVAGFSGLAGLISTRWVSVIALAAGVSTTVLVLLLTTLKPDAHLNAAGKYQGIYLGAVPCDLNTSKGQARYNAIWDDFSQVVREVNQGKYALTPGQVNKYRALAWSELNLTTLEYVRSQVQLTSG